MNSPRWLWIVVVIMLSACSRFKYTDYSIQYSFANDNLENSVLNIMRNEARDVSYEISLKQEFSSDMIISFKDLPATINATVSTFEYKQNTYSEPYTQFSVLYETKNAPPGDYYVRLYTKSKQGLYREIIQPIHVQGYSASPLYGKNFSLNDTLCDGPFNGSSYLMTTSYGSTITQKPGGSDQEFIFSKMGTHFSGSLIFSSVEASIDSITGAITLPSQNLSGYTVSGHGALIYTPAYNNKFRGYIFYEYESLSGGHYEGKVTF